MQEIKIAEGIKGLIFDLDGTIADTMPAHFTAWQKTSARYDIEFTPELFSKLAGIPLYATVKKLNEIFDKNISPEELGDLKENLFLETLDQTQPIKPVIEIIKKYHGILPMAVGTGGQRSIARQTLEVIGMARYFDILVSSDDIEHPKPHPETFLKCAELMNVHPSHCLVFEDGIPGIHAAENAGMKVIDVKKYYTVNIG